MSSPTTQNTPNKFDFFYFMIIVSCLAGGGAIFFILNSAVFSALVSSFATTSFIHRFLGGINNEDEFKTKLFKVGGTTAAFFGSFVILNQSFSSQINASFNDVQLSPLSDIESGFEVKNEKKTVGRLYEKILNNNNYYNIGKKQVVSAISDLGTNDPSGDFHETLREIRIKCKAQDLPCSFSGNFFPIDIRIDTSGNTKKDDATVCDEYKDLIDEKILITESPKKITSPIDLIVKETKNCPGNPPRPKFWISQDKAEDLFLTNIQTPANFEAEVYAKISY